MEYVETRAEALLGIIRQQPEFTVFDRVSISLNHDEAVFKVTAAGQVMLGMAALTRPSLLPFYLKFSFETAYLCQCGVGMALATLAAARGAALSVMPELPALSPVAQAALPDWVAMMAREVAPSEAALIIIAQKLPGCCANVDDIARLRDSWALLGTAEALMETGGDVRLQTDPRSALNGYGCSHRPRPWAITFASSTASSSSERGYVAADAARLQVTAKLLSHGRRPALQQSSARVRAGIAQIFDLPADTNVILAASGTDTELLALALSHMAAPQSPILNILIAPEETGRGVPMAARGRHFAVDTALGHDVNFEAPIAGFRNDTELASIALRDVSGNVRSSGDVEHEIRSWLADGIASGRRVILHALDLSKTGLLAPSTAFLAALRDEFGDQFDIVVDACQTRLSAGSIKIYLRLDAVVLITGSKFFTGPPFAGAALVPGNVAARLMAQLLPEGLDAYFGRDEFPEFCPAAERLPAIGNYGLGLRWHAALAEMQAFNRVSGERRAEIIERFGAVVACEVAANPALRLLPLPSISRGPNDERWERLPSIFGFSLRAPHVPGRNLTPVEARAVYFWLNTDLSPWLPENKDVARRICHIGQPVKLPQAGFDAGQGVLRVSAGARLISGEPSHRALRFQARLDQEMADLKLVFQKIDLILRNWALLWGANPAPRYRSETNSNLMAHEFVIR